MLYRIGQFDFSLKVVGQGAWAREVERGLRLLLRAFEQEASPAGEPSSGAPLDSIATPAGRVACDLHPAGNHITVTLPPLAAHLSPLDALYYLEPEIVNIAIRQSVGHLWIHGACLLKDGGLTLLVASTGVGKTTLSLGLLGRGFLLLTDDVFLLDLQTRLVVPVPRCPRIRPPAGELLAAADCDLTRFAELMGDYVLLEPGRVVAEPLAAPVRRVFLLSRAADNDPPGEMRSMPVGDGVLRLLECSNLMAIDPGLTIAHALFADTRFFELPLNRLPDDLACIATA